MGILQLIPLILDDKGVVDTLVPMLQRTLQMSVYPAVAPSDFSRHYSQDRGQFNAAGIIAEMEEGEGDALILILTSVDIYIPIFTYVFGAARLNGRCAIVSSHRLRHEFYGLPPDKQNFRERIRKECIHELGHLFGLRHCPDYQCVMASSTVADELDIKSAAYCGECTRLRSGQVSHDTGAAVPG